jgi:hypothetical protein
MTIHLPLSLEEGRWSSQRAGLLAPGSAPGRNSFPITRWLWSEGSPVTVTGSRRIFTGFPFQLVAEPPAGLFTCPVRCLHHLPFQDGAIIRGQKNKRPPDSTAARAPRGRN